MRFTFTPPPPEPPEEPPDYIEPGEYTAFVVGATLKELRQGGHYISWELVLPYRNIHPAFRLWHNTALDGMGAWAFQNFHEAITGTRPEESFEADVEDYFYRPFTVHVVLDTFDGKTRNRVRTVHPYKEA